MRRFSKNPILNIEKGSGGFICVCGGTDSIHPKTPTSIEETFKSKLYYKIEEFTKFG